MEKIDRSPRGFAARNGISVGQTYIEIHKGRLPAKKVGRRTIITERGEVFWQDNLPDVVVDNNGRLAPAN